MNNTIASIIILVAAAAAAAGEAITLSSNLTIDKSKPQAAPEPAGGVLALVGLGGRSHAPQAAMMRLRGEGGSRPAARQGGSLRNPVQKNESRYDFGIAMWD